VLLSPDRIKEINWETSRVITNASIDEVKKSPQYDATQPVNEVSEINLYDYYGRWVRNKR
jgi:hypothetical protein